AASDTRSSLSTATATGSAAEVAGEDGETVEVPILGLFSGMEQRITAQVEQVRLAVANTPTKDDFRRLEAPVADHGGRLTEPERPDAIRTGENTPTARLWGVALGAGGLAAAIAVAIASFLH